MLKKQFLRTKTFLLPCPENHFQPLILKSRFLLYCFLLLFLFRLAFLPFLICFPKNIFFAKVTSFALLDLLNKEREVSGILPLNESPELTQVAFLKGQDMIERDYFGHSTPEGNMVWDWIRKIGYEYSKAGENLAIGFLDSEEVHQAWNESPSHKRNLLDPEFKDVGIAVLTGDFEGSETTLVVQIFGLPETEAAVVLDSEQKEQDKETEQILPSEPGPVQKELADELNFFQFMAGKYNIVVQTVITYSLLLIAALFLVQVFFLVYFFFQQTVVLSSFWALLPKMLFFFGLFLLLMFFDKKTIIYFIPHNLRIF